MIKKLNIILVLSLLLIISVSAVGAAEDTNITADSDEAISDVYSSNDDVILQEANSHTITAQNYNSYFNYKTGELISNDVKDGDTVYINGSFEGTKDALSFIFDRPVNVVGTQSNSLKNSIFTFTSGASGSNISSLNIQNAMDYTYGIFLNGASNCVIKDCFIKNKGQSSYTICVANSANYNNVIDNTLQCYGETYGHGSRSTAPLVVSGSHYNYIANNNIFCDDANAIYFSSYDGGPIKGGLSNFNTVYNNTIKYNVLPTSWAYGIQSMGANNTIDSNTIIGAYRAISTTNYGNVIVNNKIINLTGADFNNPGVEVGGEYAIVGATGSIVKNNTIIDSKVMSTGAGISVLDNSIVEDNNVEISYLGVGIRPAGSNIIIRNNNVSTQSGSVIYWEGSAANLTVTGNTITSQSGIGVYIKKTSSKKMPKNLTVTDNFISTNNHYAIDARDADKSTINIIERNSIPKGSTSVIATPEGEYNPSKPRYVFNEDNPIIITPTNYREYIDVNGKLNSSIKDGDVLYFKGEFANNIVIYVNSAVKITGDNPTFYNTTFRLSSPGVWIDNITIKNINASKENEWGVLVYGISGAKISNCDIEVVDPNAAYAIYVVESSDVDVLNNKLASSGNYLTYTLLAIQAEDCNFINNTIYTLGTGKLHQFEGEHSIEGNQTCTDGSTVCTDGDENCVDGDENCVDGDEVCTDGDENCVDGSEVCTDGDENCVDGDEVCTSGNTIPGNHVLQEVYRTYGILMAYCSGCNVSTNKVNVTSKLNETVSYKNSTNSIVGIDLYYNTHNNIVSNNDIYVKANDNYIYGMGVLGYYTGHTAPKGEGASNNQFINNNIVLDGTFFVQGIVIGSESVNTTVIGNDVGVKSSNYSYGINMEMSQKSIIKQNTFTLNSDICYGIEAFSSSGNVINGNDFAINAKQGYGIVLSNGNNNELINDYIMNNVTGEEITYKITDSVGAGTAGVYIKSNSTNNSIKDSNITSTKGYAIILSDEAVNNTISNNCLVSEKGFADKAVNSTENNTIEGNYAEMLSVIMSDFEINYLESATLTADVSVDGAVVVFYLGEEELGSANVTDGVASLTYKFDKSFVPSNYGITAVASKEGYSTQEATSTLTINKGNLYVLVEDVSAFPSTNADFMAIVKNVNGNGVSGLEVKFYYVLTRNINLGSAATDESGIARLNTEIPSISAGNYQILVTIDESDNFKAANATSNMLIKKVIDTKIEFAGSSVYSNGILATLKDADGNPIADAKVSITVGGKTSNATTASDGSIKMPSTARGTYAVSIKFAGDEDYRASDNSAKITVKPSITGNKNYSVYYGNTVTYKVKIIGTDGKAVKDGVKVSIKVGSTTYKVSTKNGYATKSLKLKSGTYTVAASYNGDKVSNKITIKPTLIAKDISKKKAKTVKFTVKLVNKNGKILKNKKITFKIKNKKYTAKTNSKGVATLSLKNLKVGKYTITSSYGGCTISNKITIKK